MTIEQKLNQKVNHLDELEDTLDNWVYLYQSGTTFPENLSMNSNVYKLKKIKSIISEMVEVAEHIEILEEVIEEMKEC